MKRLVLIILLLSTVAKADIKVLGDGEQLIWYNNSQSFSINASSSMSASISYIWPVADATSGGQALLSDGSGLLSWGTPTTSASHNILSGTHDATTNAVTRGSIIYGNATPLWDELVIGAAGTILRSDGTDAAWSATTNITALGTIVTGTWNATAIDISGYTNLVAGTNITLSGDTLNVDDAFLVNDASDTTTGTLTAGGFTTAGTALTDILIVGSNAPATASSSGTTGTITWDADYIYGAVATNTWKRVAWSTWAIGAENVIFAGENVIFAGEQVAYP